MPYYACVPRQQARNTSFFPRHPFASDFAPFFRLLDEATNEVLSAASAGPAVRTFQPRFDVKEEKDAFHLTGELPGIAQENIQIEFVDQNTLTIHGKTVSERTSGTPPAATTTSENQIDSAPETEKSDAASASSSHQPTVEDDVDEDDFTTVSAPGTPATSAAEPAKQAENTTVADQASAQEPAKKDQPKSKYWVSERSVGQFHRSFTFPGQVNQEAVTASLKDGILNVVVPKAVLKEPRKITVN